MVTWEGMSLSLLQSEPILGHGAEEHKGLGVLRSRDELLGREAQPGLPLSGYRAEQSVGQPGTQPCRNVLWSQQEGRMQDPALSALWGTGNPPL